MAFCGVGGEPGEEEDTETGIGAKALSAADEDGGQGVLSRGLLGESGWGCKSRSCSWCRQRSCRLQRVRSGGGGGVGPFRRRSSPALSNRCGSGFAETTRSGIGGAELSLVHFIVRAKKYWGKNFGTTLVTSVDVKEWRISSY